MVFMSMGLAFVALFTTLSSFALGDMSLGVVQFPIERLRPSRNVRRASDQPSIAESLLNKKTYYALRCSLGTPPQSIQFLVDTGSSDTWVLAPNLDICDIEACAEESVFDRTNSTTFQTYDKPFGILYADHTGVDGIWAQDTLELGNSKKVVDFNFAIAEYSNTTQPILGLGLVTNEQSFRKSEDGQVRDPYPNLPVQLKKQGLISHMAYSLYMNSYSEAAGEVIFGGVNTGAYEGDIFTFPMVATTRGSGEINEVAIKLDSFYLINNEGEQMMLYNLSETVLLDSGSVLSYLPHRIGEDFRFFLDAYMYDSLYMLNCTTLENNLGGVGLTFSGVEFIFNFRDLLVEAYELDDGTKVCVPGFAESPNDHFIIGDSILRSLYVVYDLENYEVGIAKARTGTPISTAYQAITKSIPGVRAPQYNESSIPVFDNEIRQDYTLGYIVTNSRTKHSKDQFVETSGLVSTSYFNNVNITVGGKGSTTGLVTPYGGFGLAASSTSESKKKSNGAQDRTSLLNRILITTVTMFYMLI